MVAAADAPPRARRGCGLSVALGRRIANTDDPVSPAREPAPTQVLGFARVQGLFWHNLNRRGGVTGLRVFHPLLFR